MFLNGQRSRQSILVLTLPFSNYRTARMLPAQNFECLPQGLIYIFEELGRVPVRIRCDNMSTAVSKVLKIGTKEDMNEVWDTNDHPRRITDNFRQLMYAYHFVAEFCNAASGNEKGSVENAVDWIRHNFFVPALVFNGDYKTVNNQLQKFCYSEALKPHYSQPKMTILALYQQDLSSMLQLPMERFSACSWSEVIVNNIGRATVESNEYQVDALPGEKLYGKKFWNRLEFYGRNKDSRRSTDRCYDNRKDFIDWNAEMSQLVERPSVFKNSSLAGVSDANLHEIPVIAQIA